MAAADKEMEERANRAKELLSSRYKGLKTNQEARQTRKMQLERRMIGLPEDKKQTLRSVLEQEEQQVSRESRKKITPSDFESLAVIGRGAFGEVRLVRRRGKPDGTGGGGGPNDPAGPSGRIYALKSMKKEMMVLKNQVGHVRAERDILATADADNRWLTVLYYSFQDETHLYMVMEYMPGGDLMSLLMREDTFSEEATKFFMAEAAHAISSVHALGYIHRDIKPDKYALLHCVFVSEDAEMLLFASGGNRTPLYLRFAIYSNNVMFHVKSSAHAHIFSPYHTKYVSHHIPISHYMYNQTIKTVCCWMPEVI